ncbi:FAD-binding oxidoreductase [Sphingomonas sp. MMS24-J13]|uniref:FAD-binding oxidoreductase n=1 Tax=Sphingomonas sp. MMS24-J13 TaxID=3238686 RepID=UPI00384BCF67
MITDELERDASAMARTIARLQETLGTDIVHGADRADFPRHDHDFTNTILPGMTMAGVAYPRTTEQVSQIMAICHDEGLPVVPQGGLTGMAGGGVPILPSLMLSLERMRTIEELDPVGRTLTVQAGVVLEAVQQAADAADLFFPLDLGGRGTAQVGGNASTNAGGNRVLRYGMMRDLILGVEAVLADGTVISSLNRMLKNNAGYDLKHLFIGSEGTLGIITRLVLRLFPKPRSASTGLVAVADFPSLLKLMGEASASFGATLSAFEVMWPDFYRLATDALGRAAPIPHGHGIYVLMETLGTDQEADDARFEAVFAQFIESGLAQDAVIAASGKQRTDLWSIRDSPGEWPRVHWPQIGFDVSLPAVRIEDFIVHATKLLTDRWPDIIVVPFGHLADSNLHLSVRLPRDVVPVHEIEETIYAAVGEWGGSISAEHGIGQLKRDFLHFSRTEEELALMRLLKRSMDPKGILNPGKVI